jgi:hypothetical protein
MKSLTERLRTGLEPTPLNLVLFAAALTFVFFLLQGNVGLNIADEGFVWYGTIRTALGEVPLRDFQSYDPGRYYWGALWFKVIGSDGLIALRVSQAAFQFLGLAAGLLSLRRVLRGWPSLMLAGFIMSLWMFPAWKIYEPVITALAVYSAVLLVENPSVKRHVAAGAFVGLAAVFGRNHGVYCFAAFLLLILFVWWRVDRAKLAARLGGWVLGVVLGYLPMLLMLALVPGFFRIPLEMLAAARQHGTNLPLPVPWPWAPNYSRLSWAESAQAFAVGVLYLALPLFYLLAGLRLLLRNSLRDKPVLVACVFVGAAYLHYTFDRPHTYYLAWTIPPFLLGVMALPHSFGGTHRRLLTAAVFSSLLALSWASVVMWPESYFFVKLSTLPGARIAKRLHLLPDYNMTKVVVAGDRVWASADMAQVVEDVKAADEKLIPPGEEILLAPSLTTFYPVLRKESPLPEIYFLFPETPEKQEKMVGELEREHVNWAIVCPDQRQDNREDLTFRHTHAYVWQYLDANFEPVGGARMPPGCELMHRAAPGASGAPGLAPPP